MQRTGVVRCMGRWGQQGTWEPRRFQSGEARRQAVPAGRGWAGNTQKPETPAHVALRGWEVCRSGGSTPNPGWPVPLEETQGLQGPQAGRGSTCWMVRPLKLPQSHSDGPREGPARRENPHMFTFGGPPMKASSTGRATGKQAPKSCKQAPWSPAPVASQQHEKWEESFYQSEAWQEHGLT